PLSEDDADTSEVSSLNADWLEDEVEYFCTQEIFNEINRDTDISRAHKTREYLRKFTVLNFKPDERDKIVKDLESFMIGDTPNDISDRKQLAECIASGVRCFVTLDKKIRDLSDIIYDKYSVDILRPVELVLLLDEMYGSLDYKSFRLAGANYDSEKLKGNEIEALIGGFCGLIPNETKQDLRAVITECLKDVKKGFVRVIRDKSSDRIAMYGLRFETAILTVDLIRVKRSKIAIVLFQQLIRDIIFYAIRKNINSIQVREVNITPEEQAVLKLIGFRQVNNVWEKLCLQGLKTLEDIFEDALVQKQFDVPMIKQSIQDVQSPRKQTLIVEFERQLWPLKISDNDIPVYIIPIRPYWASQLFDYYLASVSLFGASESLTWSRENIYYRSVNPVSERTPGRILWYVSSEEKYTGRCKGIVGTSYLDDVYIDRAKSIFKKYKHFGVYEWNDIYKLVDRSIMSEVKALKFSDTEVFKNIIPLDTVNKIMQKYDRPKNTFPSPVEVSIHIFNEIYQIGINE
ncbi:MAG TPA: hypothetical protein VGK47_05475, partial [Nitrososphaeraceae archaeon]